ncbi:MULTISPECIES: dihydrofolate reductase family protein [Pontibacter]|uniref:Dihydrofolate reductase n=1 Tax=Pontibacter lucknowensis TaxID=1077936 RepID=A0A1N6TZM4_9BACT|nr:MULTISPECIES: dihydrofolate reductase family protein [Pontibacter]EJF11207.1 bifunctional deaminase-reductase domain-containing protein [Pontibacter sp. BAB1700]SIQ58838.1 Dihydrofolate reductase [Pontibacter lucknowensis]
MRKIILYIAASTDGFIARPDGNIDWLHDKKYNIPDEDFGYTAFLQTIDTTLMGRKTYQQVMGFDMPFPYPDLKNYVFSRSEQQDTEHVSFVKNAVVDFIEKLKEQPGKDIWLIGGGQLNATVLNAGLLDEIILTYIPIVLGKGIPLFSADTEEHKLKLIPTENKLYRNGFLQVRYSC